MTVSQVTRPAIANRYGISIGERAWGADTFAATGPSSRRSPGGTVTVRSRFWTGTANAIRASRSISVSVTDLTVQRTVTGPRGASLKAGGRVVTGWPAWGGV